MRGPAIQAAAAAAALFALMAPFQRTLYASAACLLAALLHVSAVLFLVGAPMVGFLQLIISGGAVMVLVVVTIMSAAGTLERPWSDLRLPRWAAAAAPLALAGGLAAALRLGGPLEAARASPRLEEAVGLVLFGPYAPATEAVGVLLLVAALAVFEPGRSPR